MSRTLGLKGLDVSKYQTSLPSLDGQSFIVLRSTIALTKDTLFDAHYAKARAAGLVVMAYHYAYPKADASIEQQVALFLEVAKSCDFLWLDQEQSGFDDAQAQTFIDLVRASGRPCGLYHSASGFGGVKADAQWVADYRDASVTAGYPRNTVTGAELAGWDLWQWTSKGALPGYSGNLDLDWMNPASKLAVLLRTGYVPKQQLDSCQTALQQAQALNGEQAVKIAELSGDIAALTTERDELKAENATLRAEAVADDATIVQLQEQAALVEADRRAARRLLGL